jgi:hypothetical protein
MGFSGLSVRKTSPIRRTAYGRSKWIGRELF